MLTVLRPAVFLALLDLFTLPQDLTYTNGDGLRGDLASLDSEESGFQSSFSRLGASEVSTHDPVKDVTDEKLFASNELSKRSTQRPAVVSVLGVYSVSVLITRSCPRLYSRLKPARRRLSPSLLHT